MLLRDGHQASGESPGHWRWVVACATSVRDWRMPGVARTSESRESGKSSIAGALDAAGLPDELILFWLSRPDHASIDTDLVGQHLKHGPRASITPPLRSERPSQKTSDLIEIKILMSLIHLLIIRLSCLLPLETLSHISSVL